MKRTLTLRSESLADLTPADLTSVVGAAMSDRYGRCTLDDSYLLCSVNCPTYNSCNC